MPHGLNFTDFFFPLVAAISGFAFFQKWERKAFYKMHDEMLC